ncbi:inositol monophosphatase family protein [Gemmobacter nectariphilus]|uniref:inositol monophosphatase family protein n=1 Tax=Gemmobacter nectariphilus TaxID=220343 RepID=UPI000420430F|nr:inositol monophosphatase family protein [Gemmobacter nectariphilus]
MTPDLTALAGAMRDILSKARDVPLDHFRAGIAVEAKADESPVTRADRAAEQALRAAIAARFPDHGIYGEEFGGDTQGHDHLWVIDPVDGTKSFISGHPLWGMLLGHLYQGRPVMGAVQMPVLGEVALGGPGFGAFLNDRPIAVRQGVAPADAFVCINELRRVLLADRPVADALLGAARYVRETADCYTYVQLAAGWVDGVVDHGLEPYDYLPVLPLVQAAGGVMTDWDGNPLGFGSDGRVVAGSPAVHAHLLEVIARARG